MEGDLMGLALALLWVALFLRFMRRLVETVRRGQAARRQAELVQAIDWRRTKAPAAPRRSRLEKLFLG